MFLRQGLLFSRGRAQVHPCSAQLTPSLGVRCRSKTIIPVVKHIAFIAALTLALPYNPALATANSHYELDGFIVVEDVSNFNGGIKDGSVVNAIGHPIINYNFLNNCESQFRVGVLGITYTQNQQLYTGALQKVSNLSAQREVRLAEFNYYQKLNSWSDLRIGIMDIREYLNAYNYPKELINSGFGTNRVMKNAAAVPTYPYPGIGAVLELDADHYGIGFASFQGDPQHQATFFHHGVFFLEEAYVNFILPTLRKPDITINLGFWQYQQPNPSIGHSNVGVYLMSQHVWFPGKTFEVNTYTQFGYGPNKSNQIPYSIMAGIALRGLLPTRADDFLSIGYSQIWLRRRNPEIVFELNYKLMLWKDVFLKPDLQYIVKPNGNLPNAFAGILRLVYNINGRLLERH